MLKSLNIAVLILAVGAGVSFGETNDFDALRKRLERLENDNAELRSEVNSLRAKQDNHWLNERRASEVKALVQEVLADADTRASLMVGAATAGHSNGIFYLASADGNFLLQIGGLIQGRYIWNHRETAPASDGSGGQFDGDENQSGFVLSRIRMEMSGYIGTPRFTYAIRFGPDREDNEVLGEKAVIGYKANDNLTIYLGEDKAPFLREELTPAGHQLAVDRTLVNEVFTAGYIQGIWAQWAVTDYLTVVGSINDGFRSGEADNESNSASVVNANLIAIHKPFFLDQTDVAFTVRADLKVMGDWAQFNDFSAWSGESTAIFIGGAIHYEIAETGSAAEQNNFLVWTVDGSAEFNGANVYAAVMGLHSDREVADAQGSTNLNMFGAVIQGGYMVIPDKLEPFVRVEWIDLDGRAKAGSATDSDLVIVTIGANYYMIRHRAKFTADLMWVASDMPASEVLGLQDNGGSDQSLGAIGLREDLDDDQFILRLQFQLMF